MSSRQSGFTLLEVLVAAVILSFGLGEMFDGILTSLRANATATTYQEAISLARSHLASVTSDELAERDMQGDDGRGFRWRMRIEPAGAATMARGTSAAQTRPPRVTLYAIDVTVQWDSGGASRQVRLDTTRLAINQD